MSRILSPAAAVAACVLLPGRAPPRGGAASAGAATGQNGADGREIGRRPALAFGNSTGDGVDGGPGLAG